MLEVNQLSFTCTNSLGDHIVSLYALNITTILTLHSSFKIKMNIFHFKFKYSVTEDKNGQLAYFICIIY